MIQKIKDLITRKKQLILYLMFGLITTVVSLGVCYVTIRLGTVVWHDERGEPTAIVDILGSTTQWISGVLVSFLTNKKWVFTEAEHGGKATWKQLAIFSGSRVVTYFVEVVINLGVIWLLEWVGYQAFVLNLWVIKPEISARIWAKIVSSVVVVVSNYFISKLLVGISKHNSCSAFTNLTDFIIFQLI